MKTDRQIKTDSQIKTINEIVSCLNRIPDNPFCDNCLVRHKYELDYWTNIISDQKRVDNELITIREMLGLKNYLDVLEKKYF